MRKMPNDVEKLDKISQSINSDGQGNLTVNKNLEVDGKLTLKSLVSASNPDGDITKELGGSTAPVRHAYRINNNNYWYIVYSTKDYNFKIGESNYIGDDFDKNDNYKELRSSGVYPANGFFNISDEVYLSVMQITIDTSMPYHYRIQGRRNNDPTFTSTNELALYAASITKLF